MKKVPNQKYILEEEQESVNENFARRKTFSKVKKKSLENDIIHNTKKRI
ncbi:MAG: hypothetical protein ACK5HR_00735 [Mycoplasmatales bacterium]